MNKEIQLKLLDKVAQLEQMYSNPDREKNQEKETFYADGLKQLSETTAACIFKKSSGKEAICFLYWVDSKGGYWTYFFPTESHVIGMERFKSFLAKVDQFNFLLNIEETVEKPFNPATEFWLLPIH